MEQVSLKAQARDEAGKKIAKNLRRTGMIPAVSYKGGEAAFSVSISEKDLIRALHTSAGANVIINLEINGADEKNKNKTVIIKEIQHHPVRDSIIHVDFHEISLTETITVNVQVEIKGDAIGVKRDGGILEHLLWELEIECLPTEIPEKIIVNVDKLGIGDAIHVKDIILPGQIKALDDPEVVVVSVEPPRKEEVAEVTAEEGAVEPELIRKEKKAEEEGVEGKAKGKEQKSE
ncbi:MAG: 50S ribosomal protein L25 [Candidatus Omnitrophota bacterium]